MQARQAERAERFASRATATRSFYSALGHRADAFNANAALMDATARRNNAAKAAIDTALADAVGRSLGLPVAALLGGAVRTRIPVLWTLASGDPAQELEEAEGKLAARLHRRFKVKLGAKPPEADMARMRHLVRGLEGRAEFIVDANQAWDETVALRCLREMAEMGVALVEQPVPAWNVDAMARLRRQGATPPLLADECVFDVHDMLRVGVAGAADAVSLKLVKHASLRGVQDVAAVAVAAGVQLYGGCLLESSVGAAARPKTAMRRLSSMIAISPKTAPAPRRLSTTGPPWRSTRISTSPRSIT